MSPSRLSENKPLIVAAAALSAAVIALAGTYAYSIGSKWRKCRAVLKPYEDIMVLTKDKMRKLKDDFKQQVVAGLEGRESTLMMLPSMVDVLPAGHETGDFFALDLGGTNFRTLYVRLSDDHGGVSKFKLENFPIPDRYFSVPVEELFELLGKTFAEFASKVVGDDYKEELNLGFCFSFPVEQTSIESGKIVVMTKRFTNLGAAGANPAKLLEDACKKAGREVRVRALLNDTVGTLAGGRYSDSKVVMGIILGTGTNGCYVERVSNIKTLSKEHTQDPEGSMVVNMEWGSYISSMLPMTADDYASDAAGANPGKCYFEKLISGMFMGEAARRMLLNLAENAGLFNGEVPAQLRKPWHLTTPDIAVMDEDNSFGLSVVGKRLEKVLDLRQGQCSLIDRQQVKYVCWLVANRSAQLLAVAVSAVLEHTERTNPVVPTTISVDGGVFEHYLAYHKYLNTALGWMIGSENVPLIQFNQFRESSSRGAAYLAAAVHHNGEAYLG